MPERLLWMVVTKGEVAVSEATDLIHSIIWVCIVVTKVGCCETV